MSSTSTLDNRQLDQRLACRYESHYFSSIHSTVILVTVAHRKALSYKPTDSGATPKRATGFRPNAMGTPEYANTTPDTEVDAEILDIQTATADPVRHGGVTSDLAFFDLPAEIRNTIYGYVLRHDAKVLPGVGKEPAL